MEYFVISGNLFPINADLYYEKKVGSNDCKLHIGYVNSRNLPTISIRDVSNQSQMGLDDLVKFVFPMIPKVTLP